MADNKTRRGRPDRSKINLHEDDEVRCWAEELGVTRAELQRASDKIGNSAAAVRKARFVASGGHFVVCDSTPQPWVGGRSKRSRIN